MASAHHSKLSILDKLRLMAETEKQNQARWDEFFAQQAETKTTSK